MGGVSLPLYPSIYFGFPHKEPRIGLSTPFQKGPTTHGPTLNTPTNSITHDDISYRYLDGSSQTFSPEKLDVVEMLSDIHQHAHVLNAKMEDEGKSLDDR